YRPLIRTIHNRTDTVGFLELHGLLVSEELELAMDDAATLLTPQVNYTQSQTFGPGRGRRGRGRGYFNSGRGQPSFSRGNFQSTQSSFAPASSSLGARQMTCYNCNGLGHHFRLCTSPRQQPTTPQAHYTTSPAHPHNTWTPLESGATHHLTNDLNNLALHTEYQGIEQVQLSDGLEEPTNSIPRPE
ncbi:Retrovirus-related Pol polyprotein from transposon RE1, partial [Linum grandiflorum]